VPELYHRITFALLMTASGCSKAKLGDHCYAPASSFGLQRIHGTFQQFFKDLA